MSCVYGLVDPGEANSLQITVKIDPTASGTITAGNYQISANNASKLLGSKIYTTVTSNVSYADVGVTISNGLGAVNWNQAVTYTIVATNQGPSVVTGGTLTDTVPAELTSVSWTCAGAGGGSCAASGNGNISDNTVNLPVGASVTYTMNATLAASGSATRVANTASFTMPSGVSDPQPSDNAAADTDNITATYSLTVTKAGTASGTVVSVPNAISCGESCSSQSGTFASGATMILAATPAAGKVFTGWSGGGCSGTSNCSITLSGNTAVTATFDTPPPCSMDSDCSSSRYCDGQTNTCLKRLPNGSTIPSDGIHSGTCATAGTVCVSGLCNPNNNKCAQSCSADATCPNDSFCDNTVMYCTTKLASGTSIPNDGLHTHVCGNAAAVCQTGTCNTTAVTCGSANGIACSGNAGCTSNSCKSGFCVPSSNGCYLDGDCTNTQYCNRSTLTCATKLTSGTAIPSDGLHGGTCTDGPAVCQTGLCNNSRCVSSDGSSCSAANQCQSATCTSSHCVPSSNGCYVDSTCGAGKYCNRSTFTCSDQLPAGTGIPTTDGYHAGTCSDASAVCSTGQCNSTTSTCSATVLTSCTMANECTSNVCDTNSKCGVIDGGGGCTSGNAATACQSGTCASSHCVPAGGSGCYLDVDCQSGEFCDRSTLSCQAKLSNGTAIPSDGLHDGHCTLTSGPAVCVSGGCNAVTNTCGGTNGATCAADNECIRNICGGNSKCGHENGVGPCTQVNAKFVCQSATCSATGNVCVAPSTQTCASDSDCAAAEYCDALNAVCVPDLANGRPIPSDVLHGGLCTTNVASAVCASGACNGSTQTCAAPLGSNCSAAADCAGNLCGSNGKCGGAPGQGPCTAANQASVCQSGACSLNGTCLAAGKCAIDGDCSAGHYCDGTSKLCVAQLPSGTPLPNDGDHDGTCPVSHLTAVCTTGLCSTQSNRCVAPNGTSCTSAQECAAAICGSNGKCGIEDGGGPCTPGADASCQSGSCGNGNTCDSSVSCSSDSDCSGAGGFCSDGSCTPKLGVGAPIPNDALHMATCNGGNASAVCVSGLCNATSATCAAARTTTCATASQCASNICGGNGQCGLPNGAGPCTGGNAASVCQSGQCSSHSMVCIPNTGSGCASDSDCSAGQYCDGTQFTCASKLSTGDAIPSDGIHDGNCSMQNAAVCTSGACNAVTNTCAVSNGNDCAGPAECVSNVCSGDGKCGTQNGSGPCLPTNATVCRSGTCSATALLCIPSGGSGCASDNDCQSNAYCDGSTHLCAARKANGEGVPASVNAGQCPDSGLTRSCLSGLCDTTSDTCVARNGATCSDGTQCQSGVCGSNSQCGIEDGGSCTTGQDTKCQSGSCSDQGTCNAAAACSADADCAPAGYCDGAHCHGLRVPGDALPNDGLHDGNCSQPLAQATCSSGLCNETTNTCAAAFNAPCATSAYCEANVCGSDGKCGLAVGEGTCNNLNAAIRCRTQLCSAAGVCLPELSSGCALDADCADGKYCKRDSYECVAKLAAGVPIPNDGLHDGSCSDQSAAQVCVSAGCNTTTDTCAATNGNACSGAAMCITNVCGSNGQCGIAEGDGECTAETASTCQTGRCSVSTGKCINVGLGCAADVDCDDTHYCAPDTRTCVSKLAAGGKLPSDSLHSGKCAPALAAAVCQTAACNAKADTCAANNGIQCSAAGQCVSNACGNNGECGRAVGESGCKKSSQALDCQSGFCAASGVCAPPAGCNVDGDCASDAYCNRTSHTCATKLAAGTALPSDGLHDGKCSTELAQAVCQSGQCNPVTNTCALGAPNTCTQAEQCTTGVCSDNDKCGLIDGTGPCSQGLECQSGTCQPEVNKCIATASGCSDDPDCPAAQHCDRPHVMCVDDLADGALIPADTTSGGKCTAEVGKIVCQSGACNPDNDTCARLGGADCDADAQCAAGSCSGGKCGSPDGSGGCSLDNATIACQSGECQIDLGRCVAVTEGCRADSDCASGKYCDANKLTCATKLGSGTKLPADSMHSAQCDTSTASAVCESGTCNAKTDRCALAQGEVCSSAAECGSNACLKNECVPTSKAPPASSLGGGFGCSVMQVGQTGDRLWSLCLLAAAVSVVARFIRRRGQKRHKR